MTYIDKRIINLNSKDAIQLNDDYLSKVRFNFTGLLTEQPDIQEVNISIQNCQLPCSFYNINVYNNIFKFFMNSTYYTMTITRGNYNANTLIAELLNELALVGITSISIVISPITGILTFTSSTVYFTIMNSSISKLLGFDGIYNFTSTFLVLTAPYPLNLLGTLKIRIASYDLVCKNYDSSNLGSLNILATIPVEASNFGLILYDNISNIESILGVSILDGFDLEFYDDDSNLINFNNIDWNLTLVLSITRTRQDKSKTSFKSLINPIMKLIKMEKQNSSTNDGTDNADLGTADTTDTTDPTDEDDDNNLDVLLYNNNGKI